MTPSPIDDQSESEADADRQANAMKDQLRKDVASWSAERSGGSSELTAHAAQPAARASAPRAPRQKARPVVVETPVAAEKKPFKMSYDGTTDRDYIAQRIKLGAR